VKRRIIIILFIALFVGVGLFVYVGQKSNRAGELFYSGTIEATQAKLSFQVPGRVAKVNAQEGQSVKKDQIIAQLDRADYEARYEQARANLARAKKSKQQLETVLDINKKTLPAEVARAEASVKTATDTLANAQKNYERFEELFKKGVVSEKERDAMKLNFEVAQSKLAEAESVLKLSQGNLGRIDAAKQDVEGSGTQIDATKATARQASIQLDYTKLKSPMDGVVTSRNIEPGETVNPGREVITVSDLSRVDLKIYVDETQIGKVKPNQEAEVMVDTFPGKVYKGVVSFISPEGEFTPKIIQTKKERVKLVYLVKISIANPNFELKSGMPADALLRQ
jgi:HlyD family secretion protein